MISSQWQFFWYVDAMRKAQRDYISDRHPGALRAAIRLEREIDKFIERIKSESDETIQSMFPPCEIV